MANRRPRRDLIAECIAMAGKQRHQAWGPRLALGGCTADKGLGARTQVRLVICRLSSTMCVVHTIDRQPLNQSAGAWTSGHALRVRSTVRQTAGLHTLYYYICSLVCISKCRADQDPLPSSRRRPSSIKVPDLTLTCPGHTGHIRAKVGPKTRPHSLRLP